MSNFMFGKSYTLNFDGSHINQFQKAGAGCVIRDNKGNLVVAASYSLTTPYPSPMDVAVAEATALSKGLKLAKTFGIKLALIKGDNKEVIDHLQGGGLLRASKQTLSAIIGEINVALKEQNINALTMIKLIDREANQVADSLAAVGSRLEEGGQEVYTCEEDLPRQVAERFRQEKWSFAGADNGSRNVNWGSSMAMGGGGGGRSSMSGGSSSMADTIGTAVAAIAGIGMVAYGFSKLFSGEDSKQSENKHMTRAKAPIENWDLFNTKTHDLFNTKTQEFCDLHVDGMESNQREQAAAGCVIRNKQGDLVVAAAYNLNYCYPSCHIGIAEAMAVKKGLELAKENNIKLDRIKGDNKEVIDRILGRDRRPPKEPMLGEIIEEIRDALEEQSIDAETQLQLIPSNDNKVADELAKVGRTLNQEMKTYTAVPSLPMQVADLIEKEKLK